MSKKFEGGWGKKNEREGNPDANSGETLLGNDYGPNDLGGLYHEEMSLEQEMSQYRQLLEPNAEIPEEIKKIFSLEIIEGIFDTEHEEPKVAVYEVVENFELWWKKLMKLIDKKDDESLNLPINISETKKGHYGDKGDNFGSSETKEFVLKTSDGELRLVYVLQKKDWHTPGVTVEINFERNDERGEKQKTGFSLGAGIV